MQGSARPPRPGRKLVLVDDHEDGRALLAMSLRELGYEVHEAQDGPSALRAVEQVRPDAVIADLGMPGMNGTELARLLRERHGADLRLIALTGLAPKKNFGASMEAGFDFYLMKPVRSEQLIPYIEEKIVRDDG